MRQISNSSQPGETETQPLHVYKEEARLSGRKYSWFGTGEFFNTNKTHELNADLFVKNDDILMPSNEFKDKWKHLIGDNYTFYLSVGRLDIIHDERLQAGTLVCLLFQEYTCYDIGFPTRNMSQISAQN